MLCHVTVVCLSVIILPNFKGPIHANYKNTFPLVEIKSLLLSLERAAVLELSILLHLVPQQMEISQLLSRKLKKKDGSLRHCVA